jgi:hypothetical protein
MAMRVTKAALRGAKAAGRKPAMRVPTLAKITIEPNNDIDPVYANFADVASGQFEVEINFARVPAKLMADQYASVQAGEPLVIHPSVKVIVPRQLVAGLITALSAHAADPLAEGTKN